MGRACYSFELVFDKLEEVFSFTTLFCTFYPFNEVYVGEVETQLGEENVTDTGEHVALKSGEDLTEGRYGCCGHEEGFGYGF